MNRGIQDAAAGWPDRAIGELAGRQQANVSRSQLLGLGVSPDAIERARARGRLYPVHRGVYSLLPERARPPLAAEHAALLACGPAVLLSHHTAGPLHGWRLPFRVALIHLTTTESHHRSRTGIVVHRTTRLHPRDRDRVQGLPVTSAARTLLDLAPLCTTRQLAPLVDQALRTTSRARIFETLDRHPRRPGAPRLKALLDPTRPSADTWSQAEARLLAAIHRAGLPAPEANVPIGGYVADLRWHAQRVIVEYDSEAFHTGPGVFHHDRARHNDLSAAGYEVLHVTEQHLTHQLERVIVWITLALQRGGGW